MPNSFESFKSIFKPTKKSHYIYLLLMSVALVVWFGQAMRDNLKPMGSDFTIFYEASQALLSGANPYETGVFFYPLFFCVVFIPFLIFPPTVSAMLWFLINVGVLFVIFKVFVQNYLKDNSQGSRLSLFFISFLLFGGVIQSHLRNGQINLLLLLLILLFFVFLKKGSWLASAMLSFAISLKLMPAALGLYLLVRRKWLVMLKVFLITCLCVSLPAFLLNDQLVFINYWQEFLVKTLTGGPRFYNADTHFSIGHFLMALNGGVVVAKPISVIAKLLIIGLTVLSHLYLRKLNSSVCKGSVVSVYLILMLLISPVSQTHYLVFLLPAFWTVMSSLQSISLALWIKQAYGVLFLLFIVLFVLGGLFHEPNHVYYFLSFLALWASLIGLNRKMAQQALID